MKLRRNLSTRRCRQLITWHTWCTQNVLMNHFQNCKKRWRNLDKWRLSRVPAICASIQEKGSWLPSIFKTSVIETFSAVELWKLVQAKNTTTKKLPDSCGNFCFHLQCCSTSLASIEGMFSSYGLIWGKLRNRLGFERALQLVDVYRYLRSGPNDW